MYHKSKCAYEVFLLIPTHIDTSIDSTVRHLLCMIQASLEVAWQHARHLYRQLIGMCNLGYLPVHSRIPERKFYDSTQNDGVEQHGEQSRKSLSQ